MFYSQYILAKRGPLGTIWIAAHLDRRLRKQQITETDVAIAVRACPTSSFLLRAPDVLARAATPPLPLFVRGLFSDPPPLPLPRRPDRVHHQPRRPARAPALRPAHARRGARVQPQGELPVPGLLRGARQDQAGVHAGQGRGPAGGRRDRAAEHHHAPRELRRPRALLRARRRRGRKRRERRRRRRRGGHHAGGERRFRRLGVRGAVRVRRPHTR